MDTGGGPGEGLLVSSKLNPILIYNFCHFVNLNLSKNQLDRRSLYCICLASIIKRLGLAFVIFSRLLKNVYTQWKYFGWERKRMTFLFYMQFYFLFRFLLLYLHFFLFVVKKLSNVWAFDCHFWMFRFLKAWVTRQKWKTFPSSPHTHFAFLWLLEGWWWLSSALSNFH